MRDRNDLFGMRGYSQVRAGGLLKFVKEGRHDAEAKIPMSRFSCLSNDVNSLILIIFPGRNVGLV